MPMKPQFSVPCPTTSSKMVLLFDWWLVKAAAGCSGKRLRIGGITERSTGPKVFISAPIIKRLSFCSLETADGITVMMYGVINKQRCRHNGFPSEVYDQFLIGLPYNWEECYNSFFAKQQLCKHGMQNASGVANLSSAGQGPVDGSCEPRSCSVSSFPTSFDTKEVIKFESDRNCSAANSQNEFLTPARSTVKNEMEPTTPSNIEQTSPLKKEECDLHTCEKSVRQGALVHSNARKSFASLETLDFKRSRSGRVLVPRLHAGSQDIVYDADGTICGILTDVEDYESLFVGAKSEPPRTKKRRGLA